MKKEQFFEKLAARTPPVLKDVLDNEQIREQALRDYYHKNPKQKKKDYLKIIPEMGIPASIVGALGRNRTTPLKAFSGGLVPGMAVALLGDLGRSQKYLKEQGIKSNFIGTKLEPMTEKAKKKYFKNG